MPTKIAQFNPVDYLESDEEIAEYLNNAYQDSNPEVFVIALGHIAKSRGVSEIARKSGLNRENLYKVFSGKSKPQWATIQGIMKALNINIHATSQSTL